MTTVLLMAAVRVELEETIERFGLGGDSPVLTGARGALNLIAAVTGIGAQRAREAMARLADKHRPDLIVSAGLSGGLDPTLAPGSVVAPVFVVNDAQQVLKLSGSVPQPVADTSEREHRQTLLTTDVLVHTTARKRELYDSHRAAVVDMETYHLAQLAHERGIALRALRAVSDPANMALPPEALDWVDETGQTRVGAVTASLLRQPRIVPDVMRLSRYVRTASTNLAQAVAQLVESL